MADFEEFSIGNMHPVVQPDQILSKNEDVEDDSVKKGIAEEFDALDMMVPGGSTYTDVESGEDAEVEESVFGFGNSYDRAVKKVNKKTIMTVERIMGMVKTTVPTIVTKYGSAEFETTKGKKTTAKRYFMVNVKMRKPEYNKSKAGKVTSINFVEDLYSYDIKSVLSDENVKQAVIKANIAIQKDLKKRVKTLKYNPMIKSENTGGKYIVFMEVVTNEVVQPDDNTVEESAVVAFGEEEPLEMFSETSKEIDEDIKDVIDTLNEKGYKTKYSCSGHPSARFKKDRYRDGILNDKIYSTARIVFDGIYEITPPRHWKKKNLNDGKDTALYVVAPRFKIVDGLPKESFGKWKDRYMNSIRNWVEKLPNAGDPSDEKGESIEDQAKEKEKDAVKEIEESVIYDLFTDI